MSPFDWCALAAQRSDEATKDDCVATGNEGDFFRG